MRRSFLITGLPRMRSAWLSVLFDHGPVYCRHDDAVGLNDLHQGSDIIGACVPAAWYLYPSQVQQRHFDAIAIVYRDPDESQIAYERWFGLPLPNWRALVESFELYAQSVSHFAITFADLDRFERVAALYRHCTGCELDRNRFDRLSLLRIEQHRDKAEAQYARIYPEIARRVRELRS